MKIKDLPLSERPYEKFEMYGPHALSNAELLAIILKNGTKEESSVCIAQRILSIKNGKNDSLQFMLDLSIDELKSIKGIGKVKAIQILAVCELTKRISRPINNSNIQIKSPQDVVKILMNEMKYEKREIVKVLVLNNKNIVKSVQDISYGGISFAGIESGIILKEAIKIGAKKIILVHNHPSGDPMPSKSDIDITKKIKNAADLMDIQLLDHIIIGEDKYCSIFSVMKGII